MSDTFVRFKALPEDCRAMMGTMVPEAEATSMRKAWCDECERRHAFVPAEDD